MRRLHESSPQIRGHLQLWRVFADGRSPEAVSARRRNQIQYSGGHAIARTLGMGDRTYRLAAMYIEFENVADPGDPVTIPTYTKGAGLEYYDGLQYSGARDFLRVPLLQTPLLGIEIGYDDFFEDGVSGNKLTFFAQTQGNQGVHGKTFSNAANSKVCGAALVATPVFADRTQDVVFARAYYDAGEQAVKEASSQLGIGWDIAFIID